MSVKSERKKKIKAEKQAAAAAWPMTPQESKPTVPPYTAADIIPMFAHAAIERAGSNVVPLLNGASGYLKFSDVNGGIAYLVDAEDNNKKLASFSVAITEDIRKRKCFNPNCDCGGNWTTLITGCGNEDEHEDYYDVHIVPIKLFAGRCQNPKCTERDHVWLLSECIDPETHRNHHAQIL